MVVIAEEEYEYEEPKSQNKFSKFTEFIVWHDRLILISMSTL
jgi:hypothetical protein